MSRKLYPLFLAAALLFVAVGAQARDKAPTFVGEWVINHEMTDAIAPEFKDSSLFSGLGTGKVSVSVMGIPLPGSSPEPAPSSSGAAKDPDVLGCNEMRIEHVGKEMQLTYKGVGSETLKQGDFRGRTTKWTKKGITQTYKSTSRKVVKRWEMRSDGRLLVTVIINPKKDKKRTYKRVFERPGTSNVGSESSSDKTS